MPAATNKIAPKHEMKLFEQYCNKVFSITKTFINLWPTWFGVFFTLPHSNKLATFLHNPYVHFIRGQQNNLNPFVCVQQCELYA